MFESTKKGGKGIGGKGKRNFLNHHTRVAESAADGRIRTYKKKGKREKGEEPRPSSPERRKNLVKAEFMNPGHSVKEKGGRGKKGEENRVYLLLSGEKRGIQNRLALFARQKKLPHADWQERKEKERETSVRRRRGKDVLQSNNYQQCRQEESCRDLR